MATQPNKDIIQFAANDVNLPSTNKPNKVEPSYSLQTTGFDSEQVVTAENLNYLFDTIAKWQIYFKEKVSELENQIEKERVSIGEIIEITGDPTNPHELKGYGTWESFGSGQVLVGVGTHTDDRGESKTWGDGQSEGEYKHVQTVDEMATHTHESSVPPHNHELYGSTTTASNTDPLSSGSVAGETDGDPSYTETGKGGNKLVTDASLSVTINSEGTSSPMNNTQPSIAVYRWKRTS